MRIDHGSALHSSVPGASDICETGSPDPSRRARGWETRSTIATLLLAALSFSGAAHAATGSPKPALAESVIIGALPPHHKPLSPPISALDSRGQVLAQADVGGFIVQPVEGTSSQPIPLSIRLPSDIDTSYTFIMVRGLPTTFKLSAGFRTKDAWAVSLRDIPGLTLTAPPNFQGSLNLEVVLVKGRDVKSESRLMTVLINRSGTVGAASGSQILTAAPSAQEPVGALPLKDEELEDKVGLVPPPSGVPPEEERIMMERANTLLQSSDIAAARLLFEHLAMRGSSKAAFAMGQTFDPAFLDKLFVKGLKGDVNQARIWYRKAADMGNEEARSRLTALGN